LASRWPLFQRGSTPRTSNALHLHRRKSRSGSARPPTKIDTTKSLEQVRAAAKGPHSSPVVGAYLGVLQFGIQIDDSVRKIGTGRFCAAPKYAKLKLSLGRIIYIPRELTDDRCLRSLVRDHEAKHADADAKALDIARPAIEAAVQDTPAEIEHLRTSCEGRAASRSED
jgi:hypothetical protein